MRVFTSRLFGDKRGLTLVELLASCALLGLLMLAVATIIVPFGKAFHRIRATQSRVAIADTLIEKVAGNARGAVQIADPIGGQTLVFRDAEGYVQVISSGGLSGMSKDRAYNFPQGRAAQLYCALREDGSYDSTSARGFDGWFGEGFYCGDTLEFAFDLVQEDGKAKCVTVKVTLSGAGEEAFESVGVIDLSNNPDVSATLVDNQG